MDKKELAELKKTDLYKKLEEAWKLLRKNNPYKDMTRQQILDFAKS